MTTPRSSEQALRDVLWQALKSVDDRAPLPTFINGIGGLGSPWWRAQPVSRFIGTGDALARFAALIESIAFMIVINARLMAQRSAPARTLLLAGGMSRSSWLCRRLADLLQLPITVLDAEASARGVARLAAPEIAARWPAAVHARYAPRAAPPALQARLLAFQEHLDANEREL